MAPPVFAKVSSELNFPKEEQEVLALWKEKKIFEQSLEARSGAETFIFYEGPPTANGLPHNGHVLTRVIKDLFPRYKTMQGYQVPRKAGWDTHGLPVEVEVEKELRIHGKAAIEAYGVEPFIAKCIESVFRYTDEWEKLTDRVGFWVDLKEAYVTYHKSYVESVWWALSELVKKGLLYQGHKVVWWWAQGGTALSAGEVGLGYKQVDDPSVYVEFPLDGDDGLSLLAWTTTPWTLSSNMYAAVRSTFDYVVVSVEGRARKLVIAKELRETLEKKLKTELVVEREIMGSELVGRGYQVPDWHFRNVGAAAPVWTVIDAEFVTLDSGTGVVHIAPAFGEDDFQAHKSQEKKAGHDIPLFNAVKPDGTFIPEMGPYAGRWVKDCDKDIQEELKSRGVLVHAELYRHDYPFCWRSDQDPLIQYARPAWYIRTTEKIKGAIANNQEINWLPPHIKDGRFGDFLDNNVDWALSRERYWGTPLNIWINDVSGNIEAPSSVDEILKKNPHAFDHFEAAKKKDPNLNPHLVVHKPWIDAVTWENPGEAGVYRRVPEVIDGWFDSGCMPFAQWGYPHQGEAQFKKSFPADFISEAIDQTRGWFYTLLMVSTLVFDEECQKRLGIGPVKYPYPFKTCVVLGHVSDKAGKKESKSVGNYTPPDVILDAVKMDFAVLDPSDLPKSNKKAAGGVMIAPEDLEGLDLLDGTVVKVSQGGASKELQVWGVKGLPRRVAVLLPADREELGVKRTEKPDVKPVGVPRLPANERVTLEDPSSPAPGADAFRWFFYASNPPWNATRHSLSNVRALQKETLIKLRNVYSFFTIYANIDAFDPHVRMPEKRSELDLWLLALLGQATGKVTTALDQYDIYEATKWIADFVEALSNWYVRRSRDRFWKSGWDEDKRSAYSVLYESLVTLSKLMAPFTPFMAESMFQNLVVGPAKRAGVPGLESVHLARYPEVPATIDLELIARMGWVREVVSLGLQVRTQAKMKVRQPLRTAHIVVSDVAMQESLRHHAEMIREELNVLEVSIVPGEGARAFVEYKLKPNFRTLGQRGLGKEAQMLKKSMTDISPEDAAAFHGELMKTGSVMISGVMLNVEDVEVAFATKDGFAAAGARIGAVVLETTLDDELRDLGFARELQNRVQTARKEMELEYTDRIALVVRGSERVERIVTAYGGELGKEVLATSVTSGIGTTIGREFEVDGEPVTIWVERA